MIKIHQTLHGYNQGHHLLAATTLLKSSDDVQLMSLMSDWSGLDGRFGQDVSYLTAYPLSETYYVIAMTWYANEMPRPGCVWTHSLLIRQDELDKFADFKNLRKLFRRPERNDNYAAYNNVIEFEDNSPKNGYGDFPLPDVNIARVYIELMRRSCPQTYRLSKADDIYQELILHFMNYIPGGILQRLSFSSGSAMPRFLGQEPFDLQFVLDCSKNFDELTEDLTESTLIEYIDYAISHGDDEIRDLLQMFAYDIDGSAEKWIKIITLFVHLYFINRTDEAKKTSAFLGLMEEIGKGFPGQEEGVLVKKRFALPEITGLMIDNYQFLVECATNDIFKVFSSKQVHLEQRIRDILTEGGHKLFFDLILEIYERGLKTEIGLILFLSATKIMDIADFKRLLEENYLALISMLPYDNQIINNKVWIEAPRESFEHIFTLFCVKPPESFNYWTELFDAVIKNESLILDGALQQMWKHVENPVVRMLTLLNQGEKHRFLSPSISEKCGEHKEDMIRWLKCNQIQNEDVARLYMRHFLPESEYVTKSSPADWEHFVMRGKISDASYYVYLYNLSFCWQDSDLAFEYFRIAFYPLYVLAQADNLSDRYWEQIAKNTVSLWIADWDRCKKMRLTAARRASVSGVGEDILRNFTPDAELNKEILKYYVRTKRN